MSGGAFDYAYARVDAFADALAERIDDRDLGAFSDETHAALRRIQRLALIAAQLMKEAELLYSADTSDTTFLQRVAKLQRYHDDMMRIRTADSAYAHRLATMLECALLDRVGSWDEGHALLDEYRAAGRSHAEAACYASEEVNDGEL